MMTFIQRDFSGGLNLFDYDHAIGESEYVEGFNVRTRANGFSCIKAPKLDTKAPSGLKQGLFGFGDLLILVVGGRAYYKYQDGNWTIIGGILLDKFVDRVYAQLVPATTAGYGRRLTTEGIVNGTASSPGITLDAALTVQGVQSGLVLQDGISQPYFIYQEGNNAVGVKLQNFDQWSFDKREYVPIGKQMAFIDGILFVASTDGKTLFRSVRNRPLDFVVNVKADGTKGGDAFTTSYAVSNNTITCLKPLSNGMLLVGTLDGCFPIEIDDNFKIFGEPTFLNRRGFAAGVVNQYSLIENLGDLTFIDRDGIRSFNAVSQIQNEGRNSIFSRNVGKILDGTLQSSKVCAESFDNYCFYSVYSSYGDTVLVYDTLRQQWVSIDKYYIGTIKQFAVNKQATSPALHAITDNLVYTIFASEDYLESIVFTRAHVTGNAQQEMKLQEALLVFIDSTEEIPVTMQEISDNKAGSSVVRNLRSRAVGMLYPLNYPLLYDGPVQKVENVYFNFFDKAKRGFKVGVNIRWSGRAKLVMHQLGFADLTSQVPNTRKDGINVSAS